MNQMVKKESLSITRGYVEKITGIAGIIMEKRYPGEQLYIQMLKSPDVMFLGAIMAGLCSTTITPVELIVDLANNINRGSD